MLFLNQKIHYGKKNIFIVFLILSFIIFSTSINFAQPSSVIYLLNIEGAINPITAQYIVDGIEEAEDKQAECVIIQMDTPGGLDDSMRNIIKKMLNSRVPVVIYVAPQGARAASAGAFITIAANIAAMAPGTNIGAAHPVAMGEGQIDEETKAKIVNDAAAYIKSIANSRNRNEDMAEKFVRDSLSITEQEALENNIIEFIAGSVDELIFMIDGVKVSTSEGDRKLNTSGKEIIEYKMSVKDLFLHSLTNPNIAYILLFLGIYGILGEFSNPGALFPGIFGSICLILAFVAFQMIAINFAGFVLIALGIIFFIFEIYTPTFGLLTAGGIISLTLGSFMLTKDLAPFLKISTGIILTMVLATAAFFIFALTKGIKIQRKKPIFGKESMIGMIGTARTNLNPDGQVFLHGEIWQATTSDEKPVKKGEQVIVEALDGLRLIVKKTDTDKKEE
ncbi:MAG: Membrane-bound serine protease [candidate division TA06 bacterium 34_109]|uniref:Membrane-bound serine protease n=1 Tax=candidate division TA06 bacterium 34_109 TaxID=1635277 RepID=A0A117M5Q8_UNCT6|nr:MAG: Membrane-bound serine protease [candidate division TA06 bacterium 34_109]